MATQVDVRENERFERGWFAVSMIVLAIMGVLVLTSLSGILGGGLLANAQARLPGGAALVNYERVIRVQTPTRLDIDLDLARAEGPPVAMLHLDNRFYAGRDIKDMLPHPDATRVDADGVTYLFALGPERRGLVKIWYVGTAPGHSPFLMSANGAAETLNQFVLP